MYRVLFGGQRGLCAGGFVMQRRKKPEVWEKCFGTNDERDIAIAGRAAMIYGASGMRMLTAVTLPEVIVSRASSP